jgi:hypothetical protein
MSQFIDYTSDSAKPDTGPVKPSGAVVVIQPHAPHAGPAHAAAQPPNRLVLIALAIVAVLVVWHGLGAPLPDGFRPAPISDEPLVIAAKEYRESEGDAFAQIARRVKSGDLKTREEIGQAIKAHSSHLAKALDAEFDLLCTEKGQLKNADRAATVLGDVAKALGAKSR